MKLTIERVVGRFEAAVIVTLLAMLMGVILLAVVDLGWIIVKDLITPPVVLFAIDELLEIFGFFLLVLIGLELLETVKVYLNTSIVRVEIVIEVALIAIARHIIILKPSDSVLLFGIAAVVLSLAGALHLARRGRRSPLAKSELGVGRNRNGAGSSNPPATS